MYINKIINNILVHLCIKRNYYTTICVINKILSIIKKQFPILSPLYIIEKAIFNILIPIKINIYKNNSTKIKGISIKKCVSYAISKIIKKGYLKNNISISTNVSFIFIQLYKKEHILYKYKYDILKTYLNK